MNNLDQQIENLRTLQQSYDQIAQAAEAYNTGKVELAANIEFKGVPASASENLPALAAKVRDIAQTTTVIEGGEMYAAQQFGDANPAQSPLWNLYDVLAEMKTRFMGAGQYAALIVCEYYKGYDSLQLQGADAYYTCDGDLYETSAPLHVWHDSDNGRVNRWVCFLFATAGARLDITNTAISPRSMYIGGHIGTIEYFVNGRLTEIVCGVEATDIVDVLDFGAFSQEFNRKLIIKGIKAIQDVNTTNADTVVFITNGFFASPDNTTGYGVIKGNVPKFFDIDISDIMEISGNLAFILCSGALGITINGKVIGQGVNQRIYQGSTGGSNIGLRYFYAKDYTGDGITLFTTDGAGKFVDLEDVLVGEMTSNFSVPKWNPTNVLSDADKKAQLIDNIKNHILARVSDATGGTQLVFTISTNMYNAIASETITWNDEEMTLADAFLTKNWLLAGA